MMVPIQVIRWYRMQCYDGTDSCAIVVPIRRYCQFDEFRKKVGKHRWHQGEAICHGKTIFGGREGNKKIMILTMGSWKT